MPDSWDFNQRPSRSDANTPFPILTYLLCGVCVLFTLAYHTAGDTPGTFWYQLGHFGDPDPLAIWSGRYYLLFASVFLHGSVVHLLFNVLWLARLGRALEVTLNPAIYMLFFLVATILSAGAELAFTGHAGIGASGAVYAMFGLMWAGRARFAEWRALATRDNLNLFLVWGVICIVTTFAHIMNVANFAHGGGLVFGLAIGWLFYAPRRQPLWALPLTLLVAITVLSVTWLPWAWTWNFWKGNQEFKQKRYYSAITYYQRSLKLHGDDSAAWHNVSAAWLNISIQELENNHTEEAQRAQAESERAAERAGEAAQKENQQEREAQQQTEGPIRKGSNPSSEAPASSGDTTQ